MWWVAGSGYITQAISFKDDIITEGILFSRNSLHPLFPLLFSSSIFQMPPFLFLLVLILFVFHLLLFFLPIFILPTFISTFFSDYPSVHCLHLATSYSSPPPFFLSLYFLSSPSTFSFSTSFVFCSASSAPFPSWKILDESLRYLYGLKLHLNEYWIVTNVLCYIIY
jgi:hypothetical protein